MGAYLVTILHVQSDEWVAEYVANVPAIFRSYGGEYIGVANRIVRQEGEGKDPDVIALFTLPSIEAIEQFLADPRYEPYKTARLKHSYGDVFAIET